jgi:hypothetical protein
MRLVWLVGSEPGAASAGRAGEDLALNFRGLWHRGCERRPPPPGPRSHALSQIYGSRESGMESLCPNGRSVWPNWS